MLRRHTAQSRGVEAETMRPSEEAVVCERSESPGPCIEAGIGHANDEHAEPPQDPTRLGEHDARLGKLLEAVPDEHGVERFALEVTLLEGKGTHIEAERPRE